MINGRRVIAVTPARGGSKSVPYKNLHLLGGRPLLQWPIDCALKTTAIDRVIVSTDDERISSAALAMGAESYLRPAALATDTALVADTLRHLWAQLRSEGETAEILILLEATSPFRTPEVINRCLQRLVEENLDSIATFHDADINPERAWRIENGLPRPFIEGAIPWKPRQLLTPAYQLNGAVYAFFPDRLPAGVPNILFGKMGAELVPADSVVDIDTLKDFAIANAILQS
jgi:CMP-N,N'-diacetyllegionaminic acid synthase